MLLALVYLIILVVALIGNLSSDNQWNRIGGWAQWILFAIIGYELFYGALK